MIKIPTQKELKTAILSDIESTYGSSVPLFGKVFLNVLASVQAAKLKLYYLAIGFLQKNIWVDTADPESKGGTLERYGRIKLGRNPFPAVAGQYVVSVTGTVGAVIKAGTTFKSNDDALSPGKLYVLDEEYTLVSSDSITLRALETGLDSKLQNGDMLTVTAPIANVNSEVTVTDEPVEPLAAETIETYRQRAIEAYRLEPQGGAATDYRLWAADAQGVQQVYPYAKSGSPGELQLYVEATIADSTDGKGTPGTSILEEVEEVVEFDPDTTKPLNERGRRPLGVFSIDYLAVTIRAVDITISGFVPAPTTAQQTLILNALNAEIAAIRPFISGADVLEDKNDILNKNKVISAILQAVPGAGFTDVVIELDTVSISTHTFINGDIPSLESVTYS